MIQFAQLLEMVFDIAPNFRIYCDDFIVPSEIHINVDKQQLQAKFETMSGLDMEFHMLCHDLHNQVQRHSLIQKLQ